MIGLELENAEANRKNTDKSSEQENASLLQLIQSPERTTHTIAQQVGASRPQGALPLMEHRGHSQSKFLSRLAVRVNEKLILVRLTEVLWIQSRGNLLRLHLPDAKYDCRMTMKDLLLQLDPEHFLRIHRNAIVNLDHVTEFELPRSGNAFVHLRNSKALPISRAGKLALRRSLLFRNSYIKTDAP